MKRKFYLLPLFLMMIAFVACDETKEASKYDNWQARNIAFIDSLQHVYDAKTDPELKAVKDKRDERVNIFYKVLEDGDTSMKRPLLTDTVFTYYRGMLIDEAVFGNSTDKHYSRLWENLDVFDSNMRGNDPDPDLDATRKFGLDDTKLRNGWREILQWMHPGDRWEVYIPYQSAYGESGTTGIPGYSTLIFDITLVDIKQPVSPIK